MSEFDSLLNTVRQRQLLNLPENITISFGPIDDEDVAAVTCSDTWEITLDEQKLLTPDDRELAVLHELVHVDQMNTSRLIVDIRDGAYVWGDIVIDFEDFDYDTAPWEIDAEIRSRGIQQLLRQDLALHASDVA